MYNRRKRYTFIELKDSKGRKCIRLGKKNGIILARYRDDLPGQIHGKYQWAREKKAVEKGFGSISMDAIRLAMYHYGQSDFCPQTMCSEKCYYDEYIVDNQKGKYNASFHLI